MVKLTILSPEDMEKEEINTIKEILRTAKPVMEKSPLHRVYLPMADLDKLFPSRRVSDRYDESILNNVRKYFRYYNKKYGQDGVYYHIGTAWSRNGEKVVFIQEMKKEKSHFRPLEEAFKPLEEAEIDMEKEDDTTLGGVSIEKLSEDIREKVSRMNVAKEIHEEAEEKRRKILEQK